MSEAYIVDAVRTPVGKRAGGLSQVHPADLGAHVLKALVARADVDPAAVEDVLLGCVDTIGPQAGDIARTCWLAAGLPEEVPGTTIDRQCGSSQQALHFAAQAVMSGTNDLVVAGGVQNMSMIPIASALTAAEPLGFSDPFSGSSGWVARYGTQEISQFRGAEMIADKWGVSREDMERFALESHRRALQAIEEGRFEREIAPVDAVATDAARSLLAGGEPEALLARTFDIFVALVEREPELYRWILRGAQDMPSSLGDLPLALEGGTRLAAVIGSALRSAGADSGPAEPWAFGIVGFVFGATEWWLVRRTMRREEFVAYLARFVWAGLAAGGAQRIDVVNLIAALPSVVDTTSVHPNTKERNP